METVIIYGSEYGTTEKYAKHLGEITGTEVKDYRDVRDLTGYQRIIYFGGLYAGCVKGLKESVNRFPTDAEIFVVTVGIANPEVKSNTEHIVKSIGKQLPPVFYNNAKFFHIRGGIDYKKLSSKHRLMMGALCNMIKLKSERKKTEDDKLLIETYGRKMDFSNFSQLGEIVEAMNS